MAKYCFAVILWSCNSLDGIPIWKKENSRGDVEAESEGTESSNERPGQRETEIGTAGEKNYCRHQENGQARTDGEWSNIEVFIIVFENSLKLCRTDYATECYGHTQFSCHRMPSKSWPRTLFAHGATSRNSSWWKQISKQSVLKFRH